VLSIGSDSPWAARCFRSLSSRNCWTLGFGVVFVLLGLLVLGIDPFVAFGSYQLPRIVNGEAFSFIERADIPVFLISRDFSIYRIITKLRPLGIAGIGSATAHALAWAYTAVLLWLAWRARLSAPDRRSQVLVWLGFPTGRSRNDRQKGTSARVIPRRTFSAS
jgi:hypothetical protein